MIFNNISDLWNKYQSNPVIENIHESDTMWTGGPDWYWSVGESAVSAILRNLPSANINSINSVLDFGCGWGRVARQLKRAFPASDLLFCELNQPAAQFCADTFSGRVVQGDNLPKNVDLIWVGSVFTHISYEKMKPLLATLTAALSPNGILVATFHGRRAIEMAKRRPYIAAKKWEQIFSDYNQHGAGYASYDLESLGDYGVSLTSPSKVFQLSAEDLDVKLVGYQEAGWANHQDVAAWSKSSVAFPVG